MAQLRISLVRLVWVAAPILVLALDVGRRWY
jgi:hypothetical protein